MKSSHEISHLLGSIATSGRQSSGRHRRPSVPLKKGEEKTLEDKIGPEIENPSISTPLFTYLCIKSEEKANLVPVDSKSTCKGLKIGVVLSGGQAPGGHNAIFGIFDYLQDRCKGSTLYGFKGGPARILKFMYIMLIPEYIFPHRNRGGFDMICNGRDKIETPEQIKQAEDTAVKLDLDGLVVIGGDDSNTNACLLAENFRSKKLKTSVIGCLMISL